MLASPQTGHRQDRLAFTCPMITLLKRRRAQGRMPRSGCLPDPGTGRPGRREFQNNYAKHSQADQGVLDRRRQLRNTTR